MRPAGLAAPGRGQAFSRSRAAWRLDSRNELLAIAVCSGRGVDQRCRCGHGRWDSGPAAGGRSADAHRKVRADFLSPRTQTSRVGSQSWVGWLCGRDSHRKPRMAPTACCASRGGRRGLPILTARRVCWTMGVTPSLGHDVRVALLRVGPAQNWSFPLLRAKPQPRSGSRSRRRWLGEEARRAPTSWLRSEFPPAAHSEAESCVALGRCC